MAHFQPTRGKPNPPPSKTPEPTASDQLDRDNEPPDSCSPRSIVSPEACADSTVPPSPSSKSCKRCAAMRLVLAGKSPATSRVAAQAHGQEKTSTRPCADRGSQPSV